MPTRIEIIVKYGNECLRFYKESEGYPYYMIPEIALMLECYNYLGEIKDYLAKHEDNYLLCFHGLYNECFRYNQHNDLDYGYLVDLKNKRVEVYQSKYNEPNSFLNLKLTGGISPYQHLRFFEPHLERKCRKVLDAGLTTLDSLGYKTLR